MDDFDSLPVHAQNALKRAGITSTEQARLLGRDGLSKIPGLGPLAVARLFTANEAQQRSHALSSDELRRALRWFDALQDTAPMRLGDGDRVLARKISGWLD
jgi:hypothetical protein